MFLNIFQVLLLFLLILFQIFLYLNINCPFFLAFDFFPLLILYFYFLSFQFPLQILNNFLYYFKFFLNKHLSHYYIVLLLCSPQNVSFVFFLFLLLAYLFVILTLLFLIVYYLNFRLLLPFEFL